MDFSTGTIVTFAEVAFVLVLCYAVSRIFLKSAGRPPPGPMGLPLVGYLPFLTKKAYLKLSQLRGKYGKVFGLMLGRQYTVVLGDPVAVRDAYSRPEFLGRPNRTALSPDKGRTSMSTISGHSWVEQRRFFVHTLKDLGMGSSRMEEHIKDELVYLIEAIQDFSGKDMEVKPLLASCTNNIVLALTCGKRLDYSDEQRKSQDIDLEVITDYMGQTSAQGYAPYVMKIPGVKKIFGYENYKRSFDNIMHFVRTEIKRHKQNLNQNKVNDLLSDYLLEIKNQQGNPSTSFSERMLEGNMIMLFNAGSETVRTVIDWTLYILSAYTSVQSKMQNEIDDVIGSERWPTWMDHKDMPYTQSVLSEVMRWRTPVPISTQRCTLADTSVCGYDVPKDTTILANLWDVHHNSEYWDNPEAFLATRFLGADNETTKKTENFIPFSYGKRSCPGQPLAAVEVFLFVTAILQRFEVTLPENCKADFEGILSMVNQPRPHKLRFTTRLCNKGHP